MTELHSINEINEKPQIRLSSDGELENADAAPAIRYEKRKRRQKSWRFLPVVLVLIVFGFVLGYLSTSTTRSIAPSMQLTYSGFSGTDSRVFNLATGEETYSYVSLDPQRPVVSPDGKSLAFWLPLENNVYELWTSKVNEQDRRKMGEFHLIYRTLVWSPDNKQLAFAAYDSKDDAQAWETEELYVMDVRTGSTRQLTHNTVRDGFPAWSPDGKQIVFTSMEDGYNRLSIVEVATGQRHIVSKDCFGYAPSWSPDGTTIAFISDHEGPAAGQQVYLIKVDGTGLRRLTNSTSRKEFVAWTP